MAISLQTKRKAGLKNVLESQKIPSKNLTFYKTIILKSCLGLCIVSILCLSGFYLTRFVRSSPTVTQIKVRNYKLLFQGTFSDPVRESIYRNTEAIFQKNNLTFHSISEIAKKIQEKEGLARVQVFMDIQNNMSVALSPRIPMMRLGGTGKVISAEGDIYDDFNFTPKFQTALLGVFPVDQALKLDDRNCVSIAEEEKKIILDALLLLKKSEEKKLFYSSVEYKKYRGFFAKIQDAETMIVFGYPPFETQFSRLLKILEESNKNNKLLSNIEVDYADKAFITETRL